VKSVCGVKTDTFYTKAMCLNSELFRFGSGAVCARARARACKNNKGESFHLFFQYF
jgi:hypothetical protein